MSRHHNKYAGVAAARKNDPFRMTPDQWKDHLSRLDYKATRALYRQLKRRGGDDWGRIKHFFVDALLQKQKEAMTNDD
tara:strand:+ start:436 stop:669 length:234 start_codon:yes stop_codon:yes gene_type:complete